MSPQVSQKFESILSDLSTKFVSVPWELLDSEIEEGLQRLVEFLNTDRAAIIQVNGLDAIVSHIYAHYGIPTELKTAIVSVPWFSEKLLSAEPVVLDDLPNSLPAEAQLEREYCKRTGLKAIATLPIFFAGSFFGAISTASFRRKRKWNSLTLKRLRLIGELFANAITRKQNEEKIREQITKLESQYQFEKLISDLSARFVTLGHERLDARIEEALEHLVVSFQMDRLAMLNVSRDGKMAKVTHSANAPQISAAPTEINYAEHFPWHAKKALACEIINIHIRQLPEQAEKDQQSAQSMGIRSNLVIPLIVNGSVQYVLAANAVRSEREWDPEIVSRIRLLGDIFANSLALRQEEEQRHQAELEAQKHREELAHVSRVSAAGELAASMAHELKQPLSAILTNAETALRLLPQSAELFEVREALGEIVEDDQRAADIIQKLKSMVRRTSTEFSDVRINDLIRDVVSLIASSAVMRQVEIQEILAEDLPPTHGDRIQLQQVLLNLLLNGLDAVEEAAPQDRKILIYSATNNGHIEVIVQDFGKGIATDVLKHLFEPFYTSKKDGLGIGLSIAQTIIQLHGGVIHAANNSGRGATFRFYLPQAPITALR
jgi:C4-dicarboxylate-specific signal transduction histidine kinase